MSDLKLKPCPMCGCRAEFDYGAPMNSGKRIVKVKCVIGCVEQNIFRCEEEDAAIAWNSRTQPEATAPAQDLSAAILALPLPGGSAASTFDPKEHVYSAWQMRDILRVAAELAKNHVCTDVMALAQENFELQKALVFWLPQANPLMKKEMVDRIAKDAYLLIMDGNLPDDFKTAEELHWILVETDPELTGGDSYAALASSANALSAGDRVAFIDNHKLHISTCYEEGDSQPVYEICIVHGDIEDDSLQCIGSGKSLREAIDAAILQSQGGKNG